MDNPPAKKTGNSSRSDIISNLPSNIIDNILSCLPIQEAVATSILSKEWRFKWRYLSKLVFDKAFYWTSIKRSTGNPSNNLFFLNMYRVLLVHHGPILNFTFRVPLLESCDEIDRLMLYLSEKDVQEIFFMIEGNERYRLPSYLFSCVTLRRLTLSSCTFVVPLAFQGFVKLISFTLQSVHLSTNIFETFIPKCPLLERLSIQECDEFDNLDIDIPYLKFFEFSGDFKSLCFRKPCQHLSTVIFDGDLDACEPTKLLEYLPVVKHLRLGLSFVHNMLHETMPKKLSLGCLKVLELPDICFWRAGDISTAFSLILSSPNLEKLEIGSVGLHRRELATEFLEVKDPLANELKKLRVVKIKLGYTKAIKPELEFIKFLLAGSVELEKMFIQPDERTVAKEGLKILKRITRFQRSSKKAEIVYLNTDDDDEVGSDGNKG
ncbi:F-box/FBD/LRR-repeat protein At1g13570-like [Mercurialis annua]|uniref:F-box/FBD/LRR-repeat protein At1g13570-like n=1 Tax=Mercurialis annua TaxID=3986 RepID=UPI00215DE0DF|nr:F-box/FBD/LRR-repeat protein At1g13570-like [Mercurialis annua]